MHHPLRALTASILLTSAVAACTETMPTGPDDRAGPAFNELSAAAAWNGNIRIGVVPSATTIRIGSASQFSITDGTGAVVSSGGPGEIVVRGEGVTLLHWRLQVSCSSAANVQPLRDRIEAVGYPTSIEFVATANCYRVFAGDIVGDAVSTTPTRDALKADLVSRGIAPTNALWRNWSEKIGERYTFTLAGQAYETASPPVLSSSSGLVTINGRTYRGVATVALNRTGALAGVNELHIEDYLLGVVPHELPPDPFGEPEAQKVQAIASRTYARIGIGKRAADGYDLVATVLDQVYDGYSAEQPVSTEAVRHTTGIVATYKGALIEALYSSTSGGFTANNEEVYNSDPVPYLRGKPDAQRGSSLQHAPSHAIFKYDRNASSLRGFKGGDYEADWSRYHRWNFEWTAAEISGVITAYARTIDPSIASVGRVLAINVVERGPSGRVLKIEYVTEKGTFTDSKDRIRSSLKFINAQGTPTSLLSTLFYIEPVVDPETSDVGFAAYGGGWGHGVGMSQTGAVGRAEKGDSYEEILNHYYTGISLERQWTR